MNCLILRVTSIGLALVFAVCAAPTPVYPETPGQSSVQAVRLDDPIPIDSEVTIGTFDNGLRYYIRVNRYPEKRAYLRLVVNAGSVLEDDDQIGLAHFVEHMGFNGTKHFPKQELVKYLESVGVQLGPNVNAGTGFDETVYMLTVPTDTIRIVEKAFQVLEDWARWVNLEDEEIEKERGVVVEEWRLGRGAEDRIYNKQIPVLFKDSRYAVRRAIGTKEALATFKPDAVRRFYRDWYRPDLMAVIAVGDFDPKWIKGLIETHFAAMPRVTNPRPRTVYPVPDHAEMLFSIQGDPEKTGTSISIYAKTDPVPQKSLADYRRTALVHLRDEMFRGRLTELPKKPGSPVLSARAGSQSIVRSKDASVFAAGVKENEIEPALDTLLSELARAKRHGFTEQELARAKERSLRAREWADQRDKVLTELYGRRCTAHFLRGEPLLSPEMERDLYGKLLPGIELKEVNELLSTWFGGSNSVVLVGAPEKKGVVLPAEDKLRVVFPTVENRQIRPYVESETDRPLLDTEPRPGTIVAERKVPELGLTEWTLSNGARVVLKPTDFDHDKIFLNAMSPGGLSLVPDKDYMSASSGSYVVSDCGLGSFDREQLRRKLGGKIAYANPYIGYVFEGMNAQALGKDTRTMFELVYLRFMSPRICDDAFQTLVNQLRETVKHRGASPEQVFADTITVTLMQYHPRMRPLTDDRVNEIDRDAVYRIYKDRFADASGFTFIFTGDFDETTLKPLVTNYIASLPALQRNETWRDLGIEAPRGVIKKVVRKGIEPKASVKLYFNGPFEWSRANEWTLRAIADVLQTRLREVIREDMSGTYGVSVQASGQSCPRERYSIQIGFGCAPERVDELVKAVFAQIDTLKTQGPAESSVARFKETTRRTLEESVKKNAYWSSELLQRYFLGEDPRSILKDSELAEALTPAIIREAASKYFDTNNYLQFVLLPEKEGAPGAGGSK